MTTPVFAPNELQFLLLEPVQLTDCLEQVYTLAPDCSWGYLYEDTPLAHLKEQGPIWVELQSKDLLLQHRENDRHWRENSSVVSGLLNNRDKILTHFKNMVILNGVNGEKWLFRYHHPSVLFKLKQVLTSQERSNFTAEIMAIHFDIYESSTGIWYTSSITASEKPRDLNALSLSANTMEHLLI